VISSVPEIPKYENGENSGTAEKTVPSLKPNFTIVHQIESRDNAINVKIYTDVWMIQQLHDSDFSVQLQHNAITIRTQ